MLLLTADPDADLEGALVEWRRTRRRKRLADIHWVDALYQAYITGLLGFIILVLAAGLVGDKPLSPAQVDHFMEHAAAWIGALAAGAIAIGLRSGTRGGPIALERAEVRHVLLAPVDRTSALRAPAIRQLRFLAFVSVIVGVIVGDLASKRLPGETIAWLAVGALFGLVIIGLGVGSALLASGLRMPGWAGTLLGFGLVALALAHGAGLIGFSPTEVVGRMALWPVQFDVLGLIPIAVALAAVIFGLGLVGNTSLEAAERRSTLVGQLRFAATLQDLRTVIVLRRQLAMELPRNRPWIRFRVKGTGRLPVFVRGLRGFMRWPVARAGRLVVLAVIAGASLRAVWVGTTPLVVVAGLAMFIVGLDAIEPLAQEVDHPSRRDGTPVEAGSIHVRHLPIAVLVSAIAAVLAAVVMVLPGSGQVPADVAFTSAVALALGGAGGAIVNVLSGPVAHSDAWTLLPPEVQGMRLAIRTAWPPLVAIIGATPVAVARAVAQHGHQAAPAALSMTMGVFTLFWFIGAWVRMRDRVAGWWRAQMEIAGTARSGA